MDLCNMEQIKSLLARHGFHFSKSMGQNFLIEGWVPQQIAQASGAGPGVGVLEIGPGIGPLSVELAQRADRVVAVELDQKLFPILRETLAHTDHVELIQGDVLKLDIRALVKEKLQNLRPIACANLPYNITTPAITALIDADCFSSITVMIQREAAQRICAQPGDGDYGVFSLYCQLFTDPEPVFDVSPDCFLPAPKVTSTVLRLTPKALPPEVDNPEHLLFLVRSSFAQRRKTLLNSLSCVLSASLSKERLLGCILSCNLPADVRGERLSILEFARLSREIRAAQA